jgi:hypothetical protein
VRRSRRKREIALRSHRADDVAAHYTQPRWGRHPMKVHSGDMGDTLFRRHGEHCRRKRVRNGLEPTGVVIKVSQVVVHEGDEPDAVAHLSHPHQLAVEGLADIYFLPAVTHVATVGDGGAPAVKRVLERRQADVRPRRRRIYIGGDLIASAACGRSRV